MSTSADIERFLKTNPTDKDILRAYRKWVASPESTLHEGKNFICYPPRHKERFAKREKTIWSD